MTVTTLYQRQRFTYAGVNPQAVNFRFQRPEHLLVWRLPVGQTTGTLLTRDTDYLIEGDGDAASASVKFLIALNTGDTITFQRRTDHTQNTDYQNVKPFLAETFERDLDRLTMILQEISDELGLTPIQSAGQPSSGGNAIDPTWGRWYRKAFIAKLTTNNGGGVYGWQELQLNLSGSYENGERSGSSAREFNGCGTISTEAQSFANRVVMLEGIDSAGALDYRFQVPDGLCGGAYVPPQQSANVSSVSTLTSIAIQGSYIYVSGVPTGTPPKSLWKIPANDITSPPVANALIGTGVAASAMSFDDQGYLWCVAGNSSPSEPNVYQYDTSLTLIGSWNIGAAEHDLHGIEIIGGTAYVCGDLGVFSFPTSNPAAYTHLAKVLSTWDLSVPGNIHFVANRGSIEVPPGNPVDTQKSVFCITTAPAYAWGMDTGSSSMIIAATGSHVYFIDYDALGNTMRKMTADGVSTVWNVSCLLSDGNAGKARLNNGKLTVCGFPDTGSPSDPSVYRFDDATGSLDWSYNISTGSLSAISATDFVYYGSQIIVCGDLNTSWPGGPANMWKINDPPI